MENYVNKPKGIVKPICAKCEYVRGGGPSWDVRVRGSGPSWEWKCNKLTTQLNFVSGLTLDIQHKCVDKNSNGECQDFKEIKNDRHELHN